MRILKLTLICCVAILLAIGCASEKKMEKAAETAAPTTTETETAASTDMSEAAPAAHEQITLNVDGMTWGGCVSKVRAALTNVPGVISADVSQADGKAIVKLEKGKATGIQLTDAVKNAGFSAKTATN